MYRTSASPNRSILVVAFNGKLFGVDRGTGNVVWSATVDPSGNEVEVAIESDTVIASTDGRLAFVDYSSGKVIQTIILAGSYPRRPTMVVDQGQVIVGRNGEVGCYDLQGNLCWHAPFKGAGLGGVALGFPGNIRQADDKGNE